MLGQLRDALFPGDCAAHDVAFAYDRWATRRVLAVLAGLDPAVWTRTHVVDERGLGGILVHQLGAAQRWRISFQTQGDGEGPEPEREPLPTINELRERWEAEWAAVDEWLATLTDGFIGHVFEGVPVWQMLVHLVNHGTQHRSEAAALLTRRGPIARRAGHDQLRRGAGRSGQRRGLTCGA